MQLTRRSMLYGTAAVAAAGALGGRAIADDSLPMLSETDAMAQTLGYRADASKVDKSKFPQYAAGQSCATCSLYAGSAGATSGPCPIYAGRAVAATGWCASYARKP
jgi:hypothetical protein